MFLNASIPDGRSRGAASRGVNLFGVILPTLSATAVGFQRQDGNLPFIKVIANFLLPFSYRKSRGKTRR